MQRMAMRYFGILEYHLQMRYGYCDCHNETECILYRGAIAARRGGGHVGKEPDVMAGALCSRVCGISCAVLRDESSLCAECV